MQAWGTLIERRTLCRFFAAIPVPRHETKFFGRLNEPKKTNTFPPLSASLILPAAAAVRCLQNELLIISEMPVVLANVRPVC